MKNMAEGRVCRGVGTRLFAASAASAASGFFRVRVASRGSVFQRAPYAF